MGIFGKPLFCLAQMLICKEQCQIQTATRPRWERPSSQNWFLGILLRSQGHMAHPALGQGLSPGPFFPTGRAVTRPVDTPGLCGCSVLLTPGEQTSTG